MTSIVFVCAGAYNLFNYMYICSKCQHQAILFKIICYYLPPCPPLSPDPGLPGEPNTRT